MLGSCAAQWDTLQLGCLAAFRPWLLSCVCPIIPPCLQVRNLGASSCLARRLQWGAACWEPQQPYSSSAALEVHSHRLDGLKHTLPIVQTAVVPLLAIPFCYPCRI